MDEIIVEEIYFTTGGHFCAEKNVSLKFKYIGNIR